MVITGAGGMAKELFEVLHQHGYSEEIFFFDDVSPRAPKQIFGSYVLRNVMEVKEAFVKNDNFILGLGNPFLREKVYQKFAAINGRLNSLVSPLATVGKFGNIIGTGCNIMTGVVITNNVTLGKGVLINVNASISHDCMLGDFTEISPGAVITGKCRIGNYTLIGSNATIMPGISIGKGVIVGAGAVVTKNIADNAIVTGVPAAPLIKQNRIN